MDPCFPPLGTREYLCPNALQFISFLDSSDMTSKISMQIPILVMEPFDGLLGLNLGSELF